MSKYRGLPRTKKMRHDSHFVEEITSTGSESVGRMIDIDRVEPNPDQPRKSFGDLSEMVASVKEKGILEPILVRFLEDAGRFQIIAGERRYQAARLAGLRKVPCVEIDVDTRGVLEISLVENLQRKDLSPFEEAEALRKLSEEFRYTHEEIARKLGKSRTVVTESLSLTKLPPDVMERCRHADIGSRSMLLQIVRQDTVDAMHRLIDRIAGEGMTREEARQFNREARGSERKRKNYVYRYRPENRDFQVSLTFKRSEVERTELISALRELIANLESEEAPAPPADDRRSTRETPRPSGLAASGPTSDA